MNNYRKYRIGTLHVREAREVTRHYECAAWHRTVLCPPGRYPVYAYLKPLDMVEGTLGYTLYAQFEGTVTSACFVSRIGSHYGSDLGPEMVGLTDHGSIRLPTFDLHRFVESGELELDPDLTRAEKWRSEDGREQTLYRLARRVVCPGTDEDRAFLKLLSAAQIQKAAA